MPFTDRCTSDPAAFVSGAKTEKKRRVETTGRPPNKPMQTDGHFAAAADRPDVGQEAMVIEFVVPGIRAVTIGRSGSRQTLRVTSETHGIVIWMYVTVA